ncbi:hypothetical protein pb186bvf_021043 [Paramecium bursaria]
MLSPLQFNQTKYFIFYTYYIFFLTYTLYYWWDSDQFDQGLNQKIYLEEQQSLLGNNLMGSYYCNEQRNHLKLKIIHND